MDFITFLPFITLIGVIMYIRSMFQGKAKPNRVSWLIWSFAPIISAAASFSNGEGWSILPTLLAGINPLIIFIASFLVKDAYWKISKLDYICGAFSVIALVLWLVTKEPTLAVFFAILSDGLAAVPTVIKSWKNPESESPYIYTLGIISSLTAFFTVKEYNFTGLGFQIYLILINICIISGVFRKYFKRGVSEN